MNISDCFVQKVRKILADMEILSKDRLSIAELSFSVESPRDLAHGHLATNVAMIVAKKTGHSPHFVAQAIVSRLLEDCDISSAEIAGPGFINLTVRDEFWYRILVKILEQGSDFGRSTIGAGERVNIEYVSANPTGPMHIGHCRGAVVGDVLAHVLSFTGFHVTKEYYINDAGVQIDTLARSVMLRYRQALGEKTGDIPSGLYPGEYLVPVAQSLVKEFGSQLLFKPEKEALEIMRDFGVKAMMLAICEDLALLDVHHDVFFSEKTLHADDGKEIRDAVDVLSCAGYVYHGKLPPPKGKKSSGFMEEEIFADQAREQTLFRSSMEGDDMDRPLMKSDGSFTYFAADAAYLRSKILRGFSRVIFILGADHAGYVKRLKALARALSAGKLELNVLLCSLVQLKRDGQPVRMSKRGGDFVSLREAAEEVGRDAIRFMMLYRTNDSPLDFDLAKVIEKSKDNPVFYVQYASARCHSVLRQCQAEQPGLDLDRLSLTKKVHLLKDEGEKELIRKLSRYPGLIELVACSHEPHKLVFYLHELASSFHAHWNRGMANPDLRFIKSNQPELTQARLGLVQAVCDVLTSGLSLVGIKASSEMR